MLESYIRMATEAEEMTDIQFFAKFEEIGRVLRHLPGTMDENTASDPRRRCRLLPRDRYGA